MEKEKEKSPKEPNGETKLTTEMNRWMGQNVPLAKNCICNGFSVISFVVIGIQAISIIFLLRSQSAMRINPFSVNWISGSNRQYFFQCDMS